MSKRRRTKPVSPGSNLPDADLTPSTDGKAMRVQLLPSGTWASVEFDRDPVSTMKAFRCSSWETPKSYRVQGDKLVGVRGTRYKSVDAVQRQYIVVRFPVDLKAAEVRRDAGLIFQSMDVYLAPQDDAQIVAARTAAQSGDFSRAGQVLLDVRRSAPTIGKRRKLRYSGHGSLSGRRKELLQIRREVRTIWNRHKRLALKRRVEKINKRIELVFKKRLSERQITRIVSGK